MPMNKWTMVWTEHDAVEVGEIDNAYDRKFTFRLNRPNMIEFKVPMTDRMGREIATAPYGFGLVKLYRDGVLQMVAETTTLQVIGKQGEKSVSVVATETMYPRFDAMRVNGLAANQPLVLGTGQAAIQFRDLLQTTNGTYAFFGNNGTTINHTGGSIGTTASLSTSVMEAGTTMLQLLHTLAFRASGFDFWATPVEPVPAAANAYWTGNFNAAALRGSTKLSQVFEFGIGTKNNVEDYSLTALSGEHLANEVWVDGPANSTNKTGDAYDISSASSNIFGPRARYITSEIDSPVLRTDLADQHVAKRAYPRIMYTMNPQPSTGDGRVPQFITDYDLGDIVPCKVVDEGLTLLNASTRIYGAIVSPDQNGLEKIELELNPDTTA